LKIKSLGHVVLRVRDAELSARWYKNVLGLKVRHRIPGRMVFLSAHDDSSHELGLMTVGSAASGPEEDRVGLYHVGWQLSGISELEGIKKRLQASGVKVTGVGDHGISIGIYVKDPDDNELEFYYELPKEEWPETGDLFSGKFPYSVDL